MYRAMLFWAAPSRHCPSPGLEVTWRNKTLPNLLPLTTLPLPWARGNLEKQDPTQFATASKHRCILSALSSIITVQLIHKHYALKQAYQKGETQTMFSFHRTSTSTYTACLRWLKQLKAKTDSIVILILK